MSNSWMKKSWKRTLKLRIGHGYGMTPAFHEITCYLSQICPIPKIKKILHLGYEIMQSTLSVRWVAYIKILVWLGGTGDVSMCLGEELVSEELDSVGFIIPLLLSFCRPCRCIEFQERESVETYFVFFIAVHRNSNSLFIELENHCCP